MEEQKQPQAQVVFGIEKSLLPKEQVHPLGLVVAVYGTTIGQVATNQQDIETHLGEGSANLMNPLVGGEVVGNANDNTFHAGRD